MCVRVSFHLIWRNSTPIFDNFRRQAQKWKLPQNEDNQKNEDNPKKKDKSKNEDNLKNEDDLRNEDNIKS